MALLVFFALFLALTGHSSALYCLCKDGVGDEELQAALDYACGEGGADCVPIQPNGACYEPNTVKDHCSYAVNSYYQKAQSVGGTCDMQGAATTSPTPPSTISPGCVYPSSPSNAGTDTSTPPSTGTPGTTPPSTIIPGTLSSTPKPPSTDTTSETCNATTTENINPHVFGISPPAMSYSGAVKAHLGSTITKLLLLLNTILLALRV